MYRTILAGFDGSEGAKIALREAAEFGKLFGAKVTALWVQHALPHYPETVGEIEEEKHAASAFLSTITRDVAAIEKEVKYPIACKHQVGHPASTLLKFAEIGKYDLIVLGHSGHSRLWGRVLGPYRGPGKRTRRLQRSHRPQANSGKLKTEIERVNPTHGKHLLPSLVIKSKSTFNRPIGRTQIL